jgi:hypothetical protein
MGVSSDFLHPTLGRTGPGVHRPGLSASYRPGRDTVHGAIDEGLNCFFCFGLDSHMSSVLRDRVGRDREKFTIAVRAIGISTHDRKFAGALAQRGTLDASFTATRCRFLMRKPRRWPDGAPIPTAGECYRFVLSNPDLMWMCA